MRAAASVASFSFARGPVVRAPDYGHRLVPTRIERPLREPRAASDQPILAFGGTPVCEPVGEETVDRIAASTAELLASNVAAR
jgi:hypothetical protein